MHNLSLFSVDIQCYYISQHKMRFAPTDDYCTGIPGHWLFISKDTVVICIDVPL